MRRGRITARVGAAILAAGLVLSDVVPSFAAQTGIPTEDIALDQTENILGSENGVSKVIGLEGYMRSFRMWDEKDTAYADYTYVNPNQSIVQDSLVVTGQKADVLDKTTGLYRYGEAYYRRAENYSSTTVRLTDKVLIVKSLAGVPEYTIGADGKTVFARPEKDPSTGLIVFNGRTYANVFSVGESYQKNADGSDVRDETSGSRIYATGAYYVSENDEVEALGALSTARINDYSYSQVYKVFLGGFARSLTATDTKAMFYEANGKQYAPEGVGVSILKSELVVDADGNPVEEVTPEGNRAYVYEYTAVPYAYKRSQITFDAKRYHELAWNRVTNDTQVDSRGKLLHVGYQVKVNGNPVDDYSFNTGSTMWALNGTAMESFTTSAGFVNTDTTYDPGVSDTYEVRAVYYTETTGQKKVFVTNDLGEIQYEDEAKTIPKTTTESFRDYVIEKVGDWSDAYTYAFTDPNRKVVPPVTGLTVTKKNAKEYELSWNAVSVASGYRIEWCETAAAADAAAIKDEAWSAYTTVDSADTHCTFDLDNVHATIPRKDADGNPVLGTDGKQIMDPVTNVYFRVWAVANRNDQVGTFEQEVVTYAYTGIDVPQDRAVLPEITGLAVEKNDDGSFILKWNNVDKNAKVAVFYSKDKTAFDTMAYTYRLVNAEAVVEGETYTYADAYSVKETVKVLDRKVRTYNVPYDDEGVKRGLNQVSSTDLGLEKGQKYYFAVVAFDTTKARTDRSAVSPYRANVSSIVNDPKEVVFGYYNDISTPARTSATETMGKLAKPATKSDKTSITMTFGANNVTGYQIYRMNDNGKYKKLTTTTSAQYTDSDLKESTTYSYKARAYSYNTVTKKTLYSDYVFFKAETSSKNYIRLSVSKASKKSAKLKWSKVSGASKYEIYRTATSSSGTTFSKDYSDTNAYANQFNYKWQLIKTITNPKTVTYTDRKVTTGEEYGYQVIAYYDETVKGKKTTKKIESEDAWLSFVLEAPQNVRTSLSGTSVKVTWTKDPFAKKYEIRYMITDSQGRDRTENEVVKTTTKGSYTIKNVKTGDSVEIRVRATDNKKWTGFTTVVGGEKGKQLAAAKSVKVKEVKKTVNGKDTTAVQVSWNKVSGAAYYVVYRSTTPAVFYNKDKKVYLNIPGAELIAREDNDDEDRLGGDYNYSKKYYQEYNGRKGTVVATKAVDYASLQTGVTYYYSVRAFAADGTNISSEGFTKPAGICFKATPSIKKVEAAKGKITVSINKVEGATKYIVYRSTKKNSGYEEIGATKQGKTSYVDKTVKKDKKYYYKVVAVGKNGLKADFTSAMSKASKQIKAK